MFDEKFWLAIAFIIFVALLYKKLASVIIKSLDGKKSLIEDELQKAKNIRKEAEEILASCKKQEEESLLRAEEIINNASVEADRLLEVAKEDLEKSLKEKNLRHEHNLAKSGELFLQNIRNKAVDISFATAKDILTNELDNKKISDAINDNAISSFKNKVK